MPRRAGWLAVSVIVLAVAAVFLTFQFDSWRRADMTIARARDRTRASLDGALADFRFAQAAYLATGQGAEFWMTRSDEISLQLESGVNALLMSQSSLAAGHGEKALTALHDLTTLDHKARGDIAEGERFLASDVIFMESLEASRRVSAEIAATRDAEDEALAAHATRLARWQLGASGGAVVLAVLMVLMISPRPNVSQEPAGAGPESTLKLEPERSIDNLALDEAWLPSDVNFGDAAELCVDLARVVDVRDLPALLGRAAMLLGAKGLVLWTAEGGRDTLRPTLAHGYSDSVLQRIGLLPVDGDNVTSRAFRTLETQFIKGAADGRGAIAVPILTATGCVGVLAAEIHGGKPGDSRAAVARMIAAQLATLVAYSDAPPSQKTAQG
jgi:hypothetical protein